MTEHAEQLRRAIAELLGSSAREPAALLLDGEAGIGKTTLWLDGIRQAEDAGFVVLSARGSVSEAQASFAAAADLLRDVDPTVLAGLPPVQRAALDRMLLRTDGPATAERSVATAFLSVLEALAQRRPVLLAIDDVQWLDAASRAMVGFAVRRLRGGIGVLVTVRTGESAGAHDTSWLALPRPEATTRITVPALSLGALHAMIALRVGRTLPRSTVVRIHELSRGNPFYAIELARCLDDGAALSADLPESLAAVVARRLDGLQPGLDDILLAVAAAGEPAITVLSRALRLPAAEVVDLVERLETAGIAECSFGTVRFTHPLLAHGVYGRASGAQRRRIHRSLADAVENPEVRARHLALGSTADDPSTVAALDAAVDIAAGRGAPGSAAELLELAIGLGGNTVLRQVRAAELYFRAGSFDAAARVLPADPNAVPAGPPRCLTLMLTGAIRAYDDDLVAAVDAMTLAVDEAAGDAVLQTICTMRLGVALHMLGRWPESITFARAAVELSEEAGLSGLRSQALSIWVVASFVHGLGLDRESLRTALELEDPDDDATTWFRASAVEAMLLAWTGELDAARTKMCAVQKAMHDGGTELDIIWAANHLSMIDVWLGRYADARASSVEALQRANQVGGRQLLVTAWNVEAEAAARSGRQDDARSAAGASIATAAETGAAHLTKLPRAALGFLEVSLGDYPAAVAALQPLLDTFDPAHGTEIATGGHLPDAVEALVGIGRVDEAERIVAALEENGARLDRAWMRAVGARGRALLRARAKDLDGALAAVEEAIRHHDGMEMPFELARTQLLLGQVLRRRRTRTAAAEVLTTALGTFENLGSPLWADRARAELMRTKLVAGDGRALSETERRTAELAAAGRSNREISAELFVSVKTVEMNLTRVYRKLGIRSRSQLALTLSPAGPD